jgi:DNA repair protein RecO (recombination protein O)
LLHTTKGIIINFIRYRESSIIVKIYTELFGLRTYIVNGVRNTKTAKIALYQPLNLVDLVVYENPKADMQRISEIRLLNPYQSIPFIPYKISITFFITEILIKSLKEEEGNIELFDFLVDSLLRFDKLTENFANFHLQMLFKLSEYLGFAVHTAAELNEQLVKANYKFYHIEYDEVIENLIHKPYEEVIALNGKARSDIAEYLLLFYSLHLENFGEIQSLKILRELY